MGFSKEVKEKALVASARRCCVCKEFSGRNIEVHHIIQASQGGEDSFENAIPLCFDCHANAGHYNSKHPRGSKFSPEELRKHRDLWYKQVEEGKFKFNDIEISQQFFITNSFDIVSEITKGDFNNFPINEVKLLQNELYNYLKEIDVFTDRKSDFYNYYKSKEEFLERFPDAKYHTGKYGPTYWTRVPTKKEIKEKFYETEYIANYMIRNEAAPSSYAETSFTEMGCANSNYERFQLIEAKVVFLSIFNSSEKTLTLNSIEQNCIGDGGFTPLEKSVERGEKCLLNNLLLESGKCLLIPYCILLSNIENEYDPKKCLTYNHIENGQGQDIRPVTLINNNITIGVRNFVTNIEFEIDGFITDYPVKKLDTNNLLLISRFWECGSCPHLFGQKKDSSKWEYICEVFSNNPDTEQEFTFGPNQFGFEKLKIVELENEITKIDLITLDNKKIAESLSLKKWDEYTIDVNNVELLKIKGHYSLIKEENYVNDIKMKKQKILHYIADN
jgi:hypothetical protein